MKCNQYQVLRECVERGVALGWQRAHKHHDQPSAEAIGASIEQAVLLAIGDYFVFDDDRDADRGNTSDHFPDAGKMVHQFEDARGMVATSQESRQVEPVAWMSSDESLCRLGYSEFRRICEGPWNIPVYTAPPKREPLTIDQVMSIGRELGMQCRLGGNPNIDIDYARAIERAHGIGGQE